MLLHKSTESIVGEIGFKFNQDVSNTNNILSRSLDDPSRKNATITIINNFVVNNPNQFFFTVSQEAIKNLWNVKKYLDSYVSYLNGSLTDDEFSDIAETYIKEKCSLSDSDLRLAANYLKALLPDIEVDDLSMILNTDFEDTLNYFEKV
jgi:hypothetical protein